MGDLNQDYWVPVKYQGLKKQWQETLNDFDSIQVLKNDI